MAIAPTSVMTIEGVPVDFLARNAGVLPPDFELETMKDPADFGVRLRVTNTRNGRCATGVFDDCFSTSPRDRFLNAIAELVARIDRESPRRMGEAMATFDELDPSLLAVKMGDESTRKAMSDKLFIGAHTAAALGLTDMTKSAGDAADAMAALGRALHSPGSMMSGTIGSEKVGGFGDLDLDKLKRTMETYGFSADHLADAVPKKLPADWPFGKAATPKAPAATKPELDSADLDAFGSW